MTGESGKEHVTNKPPPTGRIPEKSKEDATCPTTSQNLSCWHPSWLSHVCATRKDPESDWLARENPETSPITIKIKTMSHTTEQSSWFPYPPALYPGALPKKVLCFVSTCVSLDNSFLSVRQETIFGPWKGSPFLQYNPWLFWLRSVAENHARARGPALVQCSF